MKVVVITSEYDRADEHEVVDALFRAGLQRLHVRKPHAARDELARWIEAISPPWRSRLVLHQHHELAPEFRVGGLHWRDEVGGVIPNVPLGTGNLRRVKDNAPYLTSRSCHDLDSLRASVGAYDAVFFGPVFPSISKRGYKPNPSVVDEVSAFLLSRRAESRATDVVAIGGITAESARRALALGFDGVALLGAIWEAKDPVAAYEAVLRNCRAGSPHPAVEDIGGVDGGVGRPRLTSQSLGSVSVR